MGFYQLRTFITDLVIRGGPLINRLYFDRSINLGQFRCISGNKWIALEKIRVQSLTIKTTDFPSINHSQYFAVLYFQCSTWMETLTCAAFVDWEKRFYWWYIHVPTNKFLMLFQNFDVLIYEWLWCLDLSCTVTTDTSLLPKLSACFGYLKRSIDLMHKYLPIKNHFVSI